MTYAAIADASMELSPQAIAVLAVLSKMEPDFAEYCSVRGEYKYHSITKAWYNGRERGFKLTVSDDIISDRYLHICVAEHRSSDNIVIYSAVTDGSDAYSTIDIPSVFKTPKTIPWLRIDLAVNYIYDELLTGFFSKPD